MLNTRYSNCAILQHIVHVRKSLFELLGQVSGGAALLPYSLLVKERCFVFHVLDVPWDSHQQALILGMSIASSITSIV